MASVLKVFVAVIVIVEPVVLGFVNTSPRAACQNRSPGFLASRINAVV